MSTATPGRRGFYVVLTAILSLALIYSCQTVQKAIFSNSHHTFKSVGSVFQSHVGDLRTLIQHSAFAELPSSRTIETGINTTLQQNRAASGLAKRTNVGQTLQDAVCRGRKVLSRLRARDVQTSVPWTIQDLGNNGWIEEPVEGEFRDAFHAVDLNSILKELQVPLDKGQYFRYASQTKDFINADDAKMKATDAYYTSEFFTGKGTIIAIGSESPTNKVQEDSTDPANTPEKVNARIPKISRWSDVVWIHWVDVCKEANKKPSDLEHIIRHHIMTDSARFTMEQITNSDTASGKLKLPWPGKDIFLDTDAGLAMLGTRHLNGIAWMLHDHRSVVKKDIEKIRIFTTGLNYNILVFLK
ncbi:MAG: hypothetical protein Q9170_005397 [Blastenia crenularia]